MQCPRSLEWDCSISTASRDRHTKVAQASLAQVTKYIIRLSRVLNTIYVYYIAVAAALVLIIIIYWALNAVKMHDLHS